MLAACSLHLLVKILSLKAENAHYLSPKECSLVIYPVVCIPKTSFKVKTVQLMSLPRCVATGAGRPVGSVWLSADARRFLVQCSVAVSRARFGITFYLQSRG